MKKLLFLVLLLSNFFGYAQYTLIPDPNFEQALIDLGFDIGAPDGKVLTARINTLTTLGVFNRNITDLTGIQDFLALKDLSCYNNKLTSLDVTKNTSLTYLSCAVNQLTSLNVSKNTSINILICYSNQLTNLDVSKNTSLTYLECNDNKLTSLDFTKNTVITTLRCNSNQLTSLNLNNGNNSIINPSNPYFDLTSNPNLACIQVDNKSYSDTNWSIKKDATASYSENCNKTSSTIAPPVIAATGNQTYCPGTSLKIVESISITSDPSEPDTDAIYIQVSSGYINGQDKLTLANQTAHPTIITSWDAATGKLKLYSSSGIKIPYTDFEAAIKDVEFSNSSTSPSGIRNFSITIGQANFLPSTGHYYQFVSNVGITWTSAKAAAELLNYYGLQGYLATILAADEAQLSGEQAEGAGWIGGSDAATEGVWKWVTGPEAGTIMTYTKWNNNEPNQYLGRPENYAHITAEGVGITGSWNDLTNTGDTIGDFQPKGFIVEFGGMSGDPTLQISASTTITIPRITSTTPDYRCGTGTLTLQATAIDGSINWYDSPTAITPIATGNSFITPILSSDTIFYADAGCISERKSIKASVNQLPVVNDIDIFQCDTDLISDGKTLFNLTVNNNEISANYTNETFTYYTSLNGANNAIPADLIPNELAFENTTPTLMDIWSRITNKITGCYSVAKITLKVPATNINPNYKIPFAPVCDDFLDTNGNNTANNNNRDGITTFDFSATKAIILAQLPVNQVYNINYYKNESDALAETNVITDISNYRNIGYPNSQDIWIRIDSNLDNACYGLGPYLTLNAEALPTANTVTIARQCDDNNDGIFTFDTSSLESVVLNGQANVTVTYFDQANNPLKDANGVIITSPFPANFTSTSQTIKAVVTNSTPQKCFDETTITFIVDASPVAFAVPSTLTTACDDEANPINQDGKFAFDTSTFETTILGGQTGMIVKYYDQNNILLPSLPNPFLTNTQNITAKVQNPLNTICSASTTLNFVVNPIPNIDLNLDGLANELVCSNLSTFFVTLNAGILDGSPTTDYDYIWTKDGIIVGTNSPTLDVNEEGDYTVEVINNSGCSRIRPINVTASNIATIVSVDVVDLTDENTVTVNVTGPGKYEYSIDEPNGFWQDSNFFNNVPAGVHIVYVNDKNGCGQSPPQEIAIIGAPKFFTPNNDGYNDYWNVKGINTTFNANSIIYIFDRYGKLIKQIAATSEGWDGTFNGKPMSGDDYWYTIKLEDGREVKGHFSLKR